MELLKLAAFDAEDLQVLSAHMQDAVIRVGDICYLPREKRFAFLANRFNWLSADDSGREGEFERRRTAVHFERVLRAQCSRIRQDAKDAVLELLAVNFEETNAPGGWITLVCAGGGMIRLEVECIEAAMADLGPAWSTRKCPCHPLEDAQPAQEIAVKA
jgi:hypothetical protein